MNKTAPPGQQLWRCFTSTILLIKIALISISADQDARHPVRRSAHDAAEALHRDLRAAFDDHLIMNMADDLAEGQVPQSKASATS